MTDWIDPKGWPRDRYSGVGGGAYTGVGGGLYTGVGGGAYTGVGGGLYTGVGGGCYTGPGGGLYTGPGGGAYAGPSNLTPRRNWPPIPILLAYLRQNGLYEHADLIASVYGLN